MRSGPNGKTCLTGEDEASCIKDKAQPYLGDCREFSSCENTVPKAVAVAESVFARGEGPEDDPHEVHRDSRLTSGAGTLISALTLLREMA